MRYPVVIHSIEYAGFGAIAPDLPHCHCHADSLDGILQKMAETILQRIEDLGADGSAAPSPSELEQLRSNPAYSGGIWAIIDVAHEDSAPGASM